MVPPLALFPEANPVKLARIANRLAPRKNHRGAVRQTAFCHAPNRVWDFRGLIEQIPRNRVSRVLPGEGLGIFGRTRLRCDFPILRVLFMKNSACLNVEPMCRAAQAAPRSDCGPSLFLELRVRASAYCADGVRPCAENPPRNPCPHCTFPATMTSGFRHANREHWRLSVERAGAHFVTEGNKKFLLNWIRPGLHCERPRLAPREAPSHEAQRIRAKRFH